MGGGGVKLPGAGTNCGALAKHEPLSPHEPHDGAGWQQLFMGGMQLPPHMFMGQQPMPVMLPKQTGVKALYCRTQITAVHLPPQQPRPQQLFQNKAQDGEAQVASTAKLNNPNVIFFMGMTVL